MKVYQHIIPSWRPARKHKRVVIISDTQCGHISGLTPPQYQLQPADEDETVLDSKIYEYQQQAWETYYKDLEGLKPVDCLIANGDMIDGRGERQGGHETMHIDRFAQAEMATDCILPWESPKVFIIRGTPYHTGQIEQYEDLIVSGLEAKGIEARIGDHDWISVNGFVFDCKHKISGSTVPHGRFTAAAREELWNALWHEAGLTPRGDMIVRSHVHYHIWGGRQVGEKEKWFMITPSLQGWTRYGAQQCSGLIDWGFVAFDINENGRIIAWHKRIHVIKGTIAEVYKV